MEFCYFLSITMFIIFTYEDLLILFLTSDKSTIERLYLLYYYIFFYD